MLKNLQKVMMTLVGSFALLAAISSTQGTPFLVLRETKMPESLIIKD